MGNSFDVFPQNHVSRKSNRGLKSEVFFFFVGEAGGLGALYTFKEPIIRTLPIGNVDKSANIVSHSR